MPLPVLTPEVAAKYTIDNNSLTMRSGEKAIVIGDSKSPSFIPQINMGRWDEVNILAKVLDDQTGIASVSFDKDIVVWEKGNYITRLYESETGFEYELTFKGMPPSNVITFPIDVSGLNYFYQPGLDKVPLRADRDEVSQTPTATYDSHGEVVRSIPENGVGSYAFYHANACGDWTALGGKNYRAGKAFHLYRPKVTDALKDSAWCDLSIASGIMTITIPQSFLNKATYPVVLDPDFGYSSIGIAEDYNSTGNINVSRSTVAPASNGSLTSVTLYCKLKTGASDFNPAIYSDQAGPDPNARLVYMASGGTVAPAAYAWTTTNITGLNVTTGTVYWLGQVNWISSTSIYYKYDSGISGAGTRYKTGQTVWPDPWPTGSDATIDQCQSIYASYTVEGGSNIPIPVAMNNYRQMIG